MKRYFLFILLWLGGLPLHAQQSDSLKTAAEDAERRRPLGDTNQVYFYYLDNPDQRIAIDTGLRDMEQVHPGWGDRWWWGSHELGNLGNPLLPLFFQPEVRSGFWVGLEQFSGYRLHHHRLRYYEVSRNLPFTDLYYSQLNQKNASVRATFAHKITPQFYYSIHYNLINHFGYFEHQQARNQNIVLSTAYRAKQGKYRFYADLLHNAVKLEENGGVVDTAVGGPNLFLLSYDVYSQSAQTQYKHTDLHFQQYFYNLKGDSASQQSPATLEFGHRISFQSNQYKYFDKAPTFDYYGDYFVNERGIRYYVGHQYLENEISYRQALGGSLQTAPLWFRVYGIHRFNWGKIEPNRFLHNQAGAGIRIRSNPRLALQYDAAGQVLWVQGTGLDFWAKGRVGYDFKQFGALYGYALFERYSPSQAAERWYLSRELLWQNDFRQVQVLTLQGGYTWDKWKWLGVQADVYNHTLTNWIYSDMLGIPQQATSSVNLLQVVARLRLNVWQIGLEAEGAWQQTLAGGDFFRLPQIYAIGKLYWEGKLFKNLRLRIGANVRYWSNYYAPGYRPYLGQFHLQDQQKMRYYPIADFYISLKVWRFRFFVNAENLTQLIVTSNYFPAQHYAQPGFLVRLGVSWRIFD